MTALIPLTTRLRTSRLALVVPAHISGHDAAEFAVHGADLLVIATGGRGVAATVEAIGAARERIYPLPTLIAADDLEVAVRSAADVVFLRRPGWRPFGYRRPHPYSLFGRSIDAASDLPQLDGDPFEFGFLGPAVDEFGVTARLSAPGSSPLELPAGPVWFAAGGISSASIGEVLAAGARRVVVSRAVFGAADPFAEAQAIADAVGEAWRCDPLADAYVADAFDG